MLPDLPYNVVNQVPFTCWDGVQGAKLHLVNTMPEWKAFFELLMQQKKVACDTETTGFKWFDKDRIVGMSFGWQDLHFYVPVRHVESCLDGPQPPQLSFEDLKPDLVKFFSDTSRITIWHNFKFDAHMYEADGIEIKTPYHDTRIMWQLVDENAPGALKTIASGWRDLLGRWHQGIVGKGANQKEDEIDKWRSEEAKKRRALFRDEVMARADLRQADMAFQGWKRPAVKQWVIDNDLANHPYKNASKADVHYGFVPVSLMTEYAALDTFLTWKVYEHCLPKVKEDKSTMAIYLNELKLSTALKETETTGACIDVDYLSKTAKEYEEILVRETKNISDRLGGININSAEQLAQVFIDRGAVLTKKTESGKLCMDKKVMLELAKTYPEAKELLDLRKQEKLHGTYMLGILNKLVNGNRLHMSFNQNVATGRMSGTEPSLMNVPGKDTTIRRAFISPGPDYIYAFLDYSQVEVRLTAHFSQDPLLVDAYRAGEDVHLRTACEMFNWDLDEAKKIHADHDHPKFKELDILRKVAKVINFSIVYGTSPEGLSEQIPRPERYKDFSTEAWVGVCSSFIDLYFEKYRGVRKFIVLSSRDIKKTAQAKNFFGRVRHLPHAQAVKLTKDDSLFWMEARAQRQGVNFIVQGTAADVFKIAVVRVRDILKGTRSRMVNFIHDEIQIYFHKDEIRELLPKVKAAMEDFNFRVPLVADVELSITHWADKGKFHLGDLNA